MDVLLARLEALTARLDEQAASIARLTEWNAAQAQDIARLEATRPDGGGRTGRGGRGTTTRRRLLAGALAAGAAMTALVASKAPPVSAHDPDDIYRNGFTGTDFGAMFLPSSRTSLLPFVLWVANHSDGAPDQPNARVGLIGSAWGIDTVPTRRYGVYGTVDGFQPNAGVAGIVPGAIGVLGESTSGGGPGVVGRGGAESGKSGGAGVIGLLPGVAMPGLHVGCGVYGNALGADGNGVWGDSDSSSKAGTTGRNMGTGPGVLGTAGSGSGVQGQSTSGAGVFGLSQNNAGVFGTSPFAGVAGLSSNNAGVQGTSTNGGGVVGQSTNNAGVYGTSPFAGVWGVSANGTGVYGQATTANGWAGQFSGRVYVSGSFTVVNGAKSAAVKRKDGSHARVYCQESPEPWFEDFGAGQLTGGRATVRLGADFAEVVQADDYAVFPIPEGDCNGLYVANKTPQGFEVRELKGGTSGVPFRFRVVAKRADPVGTRMEKVDLPTPPQVAQAPRVISADELPKPPARPDDRPSAPGQGR